MTNSNRKKHTEYKGRKLPEPLTLEEIGEYEKALQEAWENYRRDPESLEAQEETTVILDLRYYLGIV